MNIILLAIIIGFILLILTKNENENEHFIDIYNNILLFTRLDDVLIKSYNVNSFINLYDNELMNLFVDNIIRINIPLNYSVTLRYALINNLSIIGKITELQHGIYDIPKINGDKIINQIDIKNMIGYNNDLLANSNVGIPMYWDTDLYNSYRPEYNNYQPLREYYN